MDGSDMMDFEMEGPHQRSNNQAFPGGCPYLSNVSNVYPPYPPYPQYPHAQPQMSQQLPPNPSLQNTPFLYGRDQYLPLHQNPSFFGHDRSRELPLPFHNQQQPYASNYSGNSYHNRYQGPPRGYPFPGLRTIGNPHALAAGADRFPNMSNPLYPQGADRPNPAMSNGQAPGLPQTNELHPIHSSVDDTLVTASGHLHNPGHNSSTGITNNHSPSSTRSRTRDLSSSSRPRSGSYHSRSYAGQASNNQPSPALETRIAQFAEHLLHLGDGMEDGNETRDDIQAYLTSGRFEANVRLSYEEDQAHQAAQPGRDLLQFINERRLSRGQINLLDLAASPSSALHEFGGPSNPDHSRRNIHGEQNHLRDEDHIRRLEALNANRAARHAGVAMGRPQNVWAESMYLQRDRGPKRASQKFIEGLPKVEISSLDEEDRTCSICYDEFGVARPEAEEPAEFPVKMPCGHVFGKLCITTWLEEHCTCPACRHKLSKSDTVYISQSSNPRQPNQDPSRRHRVETVEIYMTEMRRLQSISQERDSRRVRRNGNEVPRELEPRLEDDQSSIQHTIRRPPHLQLPQRRGAAVAILPNDHHTSNSTGPDGSNPRAGQDNRPQFTYRSQLYSNLPAVLAQPPSSSQSDSARHSSHPLGLQSIPPFRSHRSPPPGPSVVSPGRSSRTLRAMHRSRGSVSTRRSASSTDNIDSDTSPSNSIDLGQLAQSPAGQILDHNLMGMPGPFDPRFNNHIPRSVPFENRYQVGGSAAQSFPPIISQSPVRNNPNPSEDMLTIESANRTRRQRQALSDSVLLADFNSRSSEAQGSQIVPATQDSIATPQDGAQNNELNLEEVL